ncbi:MAG: transglutaminase-like cysteine peptidase [Sulfurospirillaceae bacterium]|nr:transglutaminase-like cysteine peptidase [Sulfurospirillaceae bacterium]
MFTTNRLGFFGFIALFLVLHVGLWGGEFVLSPSFFDSLKTPKSKAIFKDYERFMNDATQKPLHVKLEMVNFYINSINGSYDEQSYQAEDYWASRGEFLALGRGDCEDYVITKYYTLKDLGVALESMALCVVKEKYTKQDHMVLLLWINPNEEALILDNLSFKILPQSKRTDLHVEQCMNENGYFKLTKEGLINPTKSRIIIPAYEKMLQKTKTEMLWRR